MREIEFRGKSPMTNKWVYGYPFFDSEKKEYQIRDKKGWFTYLVVDESVGQYTGLKDKNGKKIFEDDIIHIEEENLYGLVCFENCQWYVYYYGWIDKEGIGYVYDIVNENPLADELLTNENKIWLEIVGNKYDNPELLEVDE